MKTKLFTLLLAIMACATLSAKTLFAETFETRRGSTYIDKTDNGFWPYASQWFTGYAAMDNKTIVGNQYDNDYTAVSSYTVSIRGKKLNGAPDVSVGMYFGVNKAEDNNYVRFDGGLPEIPAKGAYSLFVEICSSETDGGDLSTMVVKVNDVALEVPATTLDEKYVTSTVEIALPAGKIESLYIAFNNLPTSYQKFISQIVIGSSSYTLSTDVNDPELGSVSGGGSFSDCPRDVTITAIPVDWSHFVQWSDGNTDNPRTITLTQDTTFTAEFAKNIYSVSLTCDADRGSVEGPQGEFEYLTELTYTATPKYGYHIDHWENNGAPIITAVFSVPEMCTDPYAWIWKDGESGHWEKLPMINGWLVYGTNASDESIIIVPDGPTWVNGQTADLYLTESACYTIENFEQGKRSEFIKGYDCWAATKDTLKIQLQENSSISAIFAPNIYTISDNSNKERGHIAGVGEHEYLANVRVEAIPERGYQFTKWSDGNKENPRTLEVTKDIELEALFDYQLTGKCGKDNALTWTFEPSAMALNIAGNGSLSENYTYGRFIESLTIGNEISVIGSDAFVYFSRLTNIIIGSSVKVLEERAFYNCPAIKVITCYSQRPPTVNSNALYGLDYSTIVYVPADYLNTYQMHDVWGLYDVRPLGAESVQADEVKVEPAANTADVVWPAVENVYTYELVIKDKQGNIICTLIFNANGQLTEIAFNAPTRDNATEQIQSSGFSFTVTGLEEGTTYDLTITAKDSTGQTLQTSTQTFTTKGVATAVDNASVEPKLTKVLRNGQLFILCGDKTYTVQGQEVK